MSKMGKGEHHEMIPWFANGYPSDIKKTKVVAEIGNNHEGSFGNLICMIEMAIDVGVDAIKIQHHMPEYECQDGGIWPTRFTYHPQDKTRKDYWERMRLSVDDLREIKECCNGGKVDLIVSPFSVESVNTLEAFIDVWGYKIASGEVDNRALMGRIYQTNKPVIISTGMSDTRLINTNILQFLKCEEDYENRDVFVLQCTTKYPTSFFDVGLNVVDVYSRNIAVKCGLSDHSGSVIPGIIAAYLGADMVEVHVCFSKGQFGADISSSLDFDELEMLVDGVEAANIMRCNPVNKDTYVPDKDTECYKLGKIRKEVDNPYE